MTHKHPDGTTDYERTLAQVSLDLHPVGNALNVAASHLAYIRELLPQRGELVAEFEELVAALAYLEAAYQKADQTLIDLALSAYIERPLNYQPLPLASSAASANSGTA